MPKNNDKLTLEMIQKLPTLLEQKRRPDVAKELGISRSTVYYWIKKLRKAGYTVGKHKTGRISKLKINNETDFALSGGEEGQDELLRE